MDETIWVRKENGEMEQFNPEKVKNALRRTGLGEKQIDRIVKDLIPRLRDGITTRRIYAITYEMLDELKPEVSHRYNLKHALFLMGPEGYWFEDYISKLLDNEGYETKVRQFVDGKCVSHEIDVIASKGHKTWMIECKFHNQPGVKCRIQTSLYVYARFLDLQAGAKIGRCENFSFPWLITNTKFSEDVVRYSNCMGIKLLGWRYPHSSGLENLIDKTGCYPVSVLNITNETLRKMLNHHIITINDIPENVQQLIEKTGITKARAEDILEKARYARVV